VAMTGAGWGDRGTAPGNLAGTFCGPFRSVRSPRGPAAGQAGEQTAPCLPRHTRENEVISLSGREGHRLRRQWRRSPILGALPVVLLAAVTGTGSVTHMRDTTAEHGQHKPKSRPTEHTSTQKEGSAAHTACRSTTEMSDQPAGEHATRRPARSSAKSPSGRDLRAWAAAVAAELPPFTDSQVAAVARLATRLDANDDRRRAA
jgi:hypothetical protein